MKAYIVLNKQGDTLGIHEARNKTEVKAMHEWLYPDWEEEIEIHLLHE